MSLGLSSVNSTYHGQNKCNSRQRDGGLEVVFILDPLATSTVEPHSDEDLVNRNVEVHPLALAWILEHEGLSTHAFISPDSSIAFPDLLLSVFLSNSGHS